MFTLKAPDSVSENFSIKLTLFNFLQKHVRTASIDELDYVLKSTGNHVLLNTSISQHFQIGVPETDSCRDVAEWGVLDNLFFFELFVDRLLENGLGVLEVHDIETDLLTLDTPVIDVNEILLQKRSGDLTSVDLRPTDSSVSNIESIDGTVTL